MNSDRSCVSLRVRAGSALSGDLGAFRGSLRRSLRQAGGSSLSGRGTVGDVPPGSCIVYAGVSVCVGVCLGGSMSGCLCHWQGWTEQKS